MKQRLQAMALRVVRLAQAKEDLELEVSTLRAQLEHCRRSLAGCVAKGGSA